MQLRLGRDEAKRSPIRRVDHASPHGDALLLSSAVVVVAPDAVPERGHVERARESHLSVPLARGSEDGWRERREASAELAACHFRPRRLNPAHRRGCWRAVTTAVLVRWRCPLSHRASLSASGLETSILYPGNIQYIRERELVGVVMTTVSGVVRWRDWALVLRLYMFSRGPHDSSAHLGPRAPTRPRQRPTRPCRGDR